MNKNKKMLTEASKQQHKRTLRIAESPKRVTKLKLGLILQAKKASQLSDINDTLKNKQEYPQTSHVQRGQYNPYEMAYLNDMAHWKDYCDATDRYEQAGINLKWPYYFGSREEKKSQRS